MTAPPLIAVVPFALMLLAIALGPVCYPQWWESNRNKLVVGAALSLPVVLLYASRHPAALLHTGRDYVSFIVLLSGLFVVASGVILRGDLAATPATNTGFLALGGALASIVGTTGASMLLIRPLLQTNRQRTHVRHTIVFFIFIVSNIGGMLTPLGDPPLFLGYLAGVPFTWTFRLLPVWASMVAILLAAFFVYDTVQFSREPPQAVRRDRAQVQPLRVEGLQSTLWLGGIILAVAFARAPWRELLILGCVGLSLMTTPGHIRRDNRFSAAPMVEVAVLFAGLFFTMIPALEVLQVRGGDLNVRTASQFFWASGLLSSFLDNAPTYLAFLALARSLELAPEVVGVPHALLAAISIGAVAMGANTYIGNAPNFMVKAIAEDAGVRMPGFFGYMGYSATILLPLFVFITFVFLR